MTVDTTTNALDVLHEQHEDVEDLIEQVEDADDPDDKGRLFAELADKLAAHTAIEERLFYPALLTEDTRERLVEATEEHLAFKRLLADMLAMEPDDEHFDAKLTVLKENVRHHVHDEEEPELFEIAEQMMDEDELAALGNEMLALYEQLLEQEPRRHVPEETAEAAELGAPI